MTTDANPHYLELRQWMRDKEVTCKFVASFLGVSEGAISKIFKRSTMPTKHHIPCVSMGFPVELLPKAEDRKRGPRPKIPTIPAMRRLCQASARV